MKLRNFINGKAAQGKNTASKLVRFPTVRHYVSMHLVVSGSERLGDKVRRDRKFVLYPSTNVRAALDKMNAENVFAFEMYFSGRLDL